jgi:membrane-associated phospholipid phosphatase
MADTLPFSKRRFWYTTERMIAFWVSVLFHPVVLPTLFFIFAAVTTPEIITPFSSGGLQLRFILLIFITTMLIPIAMLCLHLILSKRKISLQMLYLQNTKDRVYPFLHTGLFYGGITYLFYANLHLNPFICSFMGMVTLAVLLSAGISTFYKISAHVLALSALTGYVFLLHFFLPEVNLLISACSLIFITGLTASCRLLLNAHTPGQILGGFVVGLLCTLSCIVWFY